MQRSKVNILMKTAGEIKLKRRTKRDEEKGKVSETKKRSRVCKKTKMI